MDAARSGLTPQKDTQLPLCSALYLHALCVYTFYRAFHRSVPGKFSTFKLPAISLSKVLYQKETLKLKPNQNKLKSQPQIPKKTNVKVVEKGIGKTL